MKAKTIVVMFAVLFFLVISSSIILNNKYTLKDFFGQKNFGVSGNVVSKDEFSLYLENQDIINDIPSDGVISLKFYSFENDERQWEKEYTIKKGSVQEGQAETPDITVIMNSKYLENIENKEYICSVIKKAKENGDIGFEIHRSLAPFFWKYRKILGHEDCLN